MRIFEVRFLTALALIGVSSLVVAHGYEIASFAMARRDSSEIGRAERIDPWRSVPGVAAAARQMSVSPTWDPRDSQTAIIGRERALSDVALIRPMSANTWLSVAAMRAVSDRPMEKTVSALMLSILTGPNEGEVIPQRGILEIYLWEALPEDLRARAIVDLAAALELWTTMSQSERQNIAAVFASKSEDVRKDIQARLQTTPAVTLDLMKRAGLVSGS